MYVFDRNGIWRLRDTNGDGEADVHELFSNAFAQTADMREFPSTMRLAPGGEFVIAKGGQEATTHRQTQRQRAAHLRRRPHARRCSATASASHSIGVNLRTGLVTASDQQGNYIPSTPLHIVRDRQFYGFLSDKLPREVYPAPIADPLTWIPHAVNASALSQVWLFGARMGPLNDGLVYIGFNKPELFRVLLNNRDREAAGGGREHHARVRVSAAERLGESGRRPALHRRLSDSRLGHDRDAACRPGPRAVHRRTLDAAARRRADGQGRAAALRRRRSIPQRRPIRTTTRRAAGTTSAPTNTARRSSRPTARRASIGSTPSERVSLEGRPQRVHRRAAG